MPGELEKGLNVGNEPNRSELRTGNEPKIRTGSHRELQFPIQFELGTLASRYDDKARCKGSWVSNFRFFRVHGTRC